MTRAYFVLAGTVIAALAIVVDTLVRKLTRSR